MNKNSKWSKLFELLGFISTSSDMVCSNSNPIDYTDNIGIIMENNGKDKFEGKKGMKIAKLICARIENPEMVEVSSLRKKEKNMSRSSGIYVLETKLRKD